MLYMCDALCRVCISSGNASCVMSTFLSCRGIVLSCFFVCVFSEPLQLLGGGCRDDAWNTGPDSATELFRALETNSTLRSLSFHGLFVDFFVVKVLFLF